MLFDNISPFLRFATKQKLFSKKNLINYDHRFYYCLNGSGEVSLNGKSYVMNPHSLLLWRAGTLYSYSKADDAEIFEVVSCNFDYTRISEGKQTPVPPSNRKFFNESKFLSEKELFSDFVQFNDVIFIQNATILQDLMHSIAQDFGQNNNLRRIVLNHRLTEIIYNIATIIDTKNNDQDPLVRSVLNYLESHYLADAPSLNDLGRIFSYHPNHLNQLVHKNSGLSIHQHLIKLKMNKAMKYLMTTDYSISEIAEKIGMNDSRYFSRIFKKTFGTMPSSFRRHV